MDDFLTGLYKQEQEKIAAADLGDFMDTLPANELEEFLGLTKSAVAGPTEGELPSSEGGELDKAQKRVDNYVNKSQGISPPTRKESEEASSVSYQGPGTEAKKEAMVHRLQKIAGCMSKTDAFTSPEAKKKAKVMSATMKMGKGEPTQARKKALNIAGKMKISQGDEEEGMETTAAAKAKIAMRIMKITSGAPAHVKTAAARVAGREMAKISTQCKEADPLIGGLAGYYSQGDPDATPKSGFWRGAGLGTLGGIAGSLAGRKIGGQPGALTGSLAGALGGGYLGGRSAKLGKHEAAAYKKQQKAMRAAAAKDKK